MWWRNSPKSKIPNSFKMHHSRGDSIRGRLFPPKSWRTSARRNDLWQPTKIEINSNSLLSLCDKSIVWIDPLWFFSFSLFIETKAALKVSIPTLYCCSSILPIVSTKTGSFQNNEKKTQSTKAVRKTIEKTTIDWFIHSWNLNIARLSNSIVE